MCKQCKTNLVHNTHSEYMCKDCWMAVPRCRCGSRVQPICDRSDLRCHKDQGATVDEEGDYCGLCTKHAKSGEFGQEARNVCCICPGFATCKHSAHRAEFDDCCASGRGRGLCSVFAPCPADECKRGKPEATVDPGATACPKRGTGLQNLRTSHWERGLCATCEKARANDPEARDDDIVEYLQTKTVDGQKYGLKARPSWNAIAVFMGICNGTRPMTEADVTEEVDRAREEVRWHLRRAVKDYFTMMRIIRTPGLADVSDEFAAKKRSEHLGAFQVQVGQAPPLAPGRFPVLELEERQRALTSFLKNSPHMEEFTYQQEQRKARRAAEEAQSIAAARLEDPSSDSDWCDIELPDEYAGWLARPDLGPTWSTTPTQGAPITCLLCGPEPRGFGTKEAFKIHMDNEHRGELFYRARRFYNEDTEPPAPTAGQAVRATCAEWALRYRHGLEDWPDAPNTEDGKIDLSKLPPRRRWACVCCGVEKWAAAFVVTTWTELVERHSEAAEEEGDGKRRGRKAQKRSDAATSKTRDIRSFFSPKPAIEKASASKPRTMREISTARARAMKERHRRGESASDEEERGSDPEPDDTEPAPSDGAQWAEDFAQLFSVDKYLENAAQRDLQAQAVTGEAWRSSVRLPDSGKSVMLHKRRIPLVWSAAFSDMVMDPHGKLRFCNGCHDMVKQTRPKMPRTAIANLPLFRECPLFFPDREKLGKTLALRRARATIQQVYLSDKALKPGRHLSARARALRQVGVRGNAVFYGHGSAGQMLDKVRPTEQPSVVRFVPKGGAVAWLRSRCAESERGRAPRSRGGALRESREPQRCLYWRRPDRLAAQ